MNFIKSNVSECGAALKGLGGRAQTLRQEKGVPIVVLANLEVADKLGVAFLLWMLAFLGGTGGGFLGVLSPSICRS
ncbi:MAG: hypothetical protein ACKV2U_05020 [Bryobacteraceae bacterium]